MREYSYYFGEKTVNVLRDASDPKSVVTGKIYFGVRVQNLLLKNDSFYKNCGFLLQSEVEALSDPTGPTVTSLIGLRCLVTQLDHTLQGQVKIHG